MNTPLSALALAMSLVMAACSGPAPVPTLTESDAIQSKHPTSPLPSSSASVAASSEYNPPLAPTTDSGMNEDGDYVNQTGSAPIMLDDPKVAFPITIEHVYGSTTIKKQPRKLVALDEASTGAATSMLRIPNAFPKSAVSQNKPGVYPWMDGIIDGFSVEPETPKGPTLLDMTNGVPFDEIKAVQPDVILGLQDNISKADYERLSEIAPVVLRPGKAGETTPRELVLRTGKALGQYNHAKAIVGDEDIYYESDGQDFSLYKGKTILIADIPTDPNKPLAVYPNTNVRVLTMQYIGFKPAAITQSKKAPADQQTFELGAENTSDAASDLVIAFANSNEEADQMRKNTAAQALPANAKGNLIIITDATIKNALASGDPISTTEAYSAIDKILKEQAHLN